MQKIKCYFKQAIWGVIMYFPYLRGRQFELIALRELIDEGLIGDKIVPIIEPIKPTATLVKTLKSFIDNNHKLALVMNPEVGEFVSLIKEKDGDNDKIIEEIMEGSKQENIIKAYIMKKTTPKLLQKKRNKYDYMIINPKRDCMDAFLEVYEEEEPIYSLIPDDRTFERKAPNSKVIFMDRFQKAAKNADYSRNEDEFFSSDHVFFDKEGFKGFSDYSIVGAEYNETGFAPAAVAIHLVYFDKRKELRVRHFVSDSNVGQRDPAGKFGEAVAKLVEWMTTENVPKTEGLQAFIDCYNEGRYPGLGTVKKYSIMHHLELMNKFLEGDI